MDDDQQRAQYDDECQLQADMLKALDAALVRPLSKEEALLLAWGSGVAQEFSRHEHSPERN